MKYFLLFDIFGIQYNFLRNGSVDKQTKIGAIFSILYFISYIALFLGFGMDLILKKNFKLSYDSNLEDYKEISINNDIFMFAYRIEDKYGTEIKDSSIINFEVNKYKYELINGTWNKSFREDLTKTRCSDLSNIKKKEEYYNISLKNWYCVNFENLTLGGYWDGNIVNVLNIEARKCKNSSAITCQSNENITNQFHTERGANLYFSYLYMDKMLSFDNYSNPIKTALINRYQMLDLNIEKNHVHLFKKTTLKDDRGWILSDINETEIYSSDYINSDFSFSDQNKDSLLFFYNMYFGRKIDTYNRSYDKVQDIIASISGFSEFFYFVISSIFIYFSDISKNLDLIEISNPYNFNNNSIKDSKIQISDNKLVTTNRSKLNKSFINLKYTKKELDYISIAKQKLCCKINNKKSNEQKMCLLEYEAIENYHNLKFDVSTYLCLIKEFDLMKKILLEDIQQKALEIINTNYKIEEPIDVNILIPKIQEYISNNNLSEINKRLFSYLELDKFK